MSVLQWVIIILKRTSNNLQSLINFDSLIVPSPNSDLNGGEKAAISIGVILAIILIILCILAYCLGWCCFKNRRKSKEQSKLEVHDEPQNIDNVFDHPPVPVHVEPEPYKTVYQYYQQPQFKPWPIVKDPSPKPVIDYQDNSAEDELLGRDKTLFCLLDNCLTFATYLPRGTIVNLLSKQTDKCIKRID